MISRIARLCPYKITSNAGPVARAEPTACSEMVRSGPAPARQPGPPALPSLPCHPPQAALTHSCCQPSGKAVLVQQVQEGGFAHIRVSQEDDVEGIIRVGQRFTGRVVPRGRGQPRASRVRSWIFRPVLCPWLPGLRGGLFSFCMGSCRPGPGLGF